MNTVKGEDLFMVKDDVGIKINQSSQVNQARNCKDS